MTDDVWSVIKEEVRLRIQAEPTLEPYLNLLVLSQDSLVSAIASIISSKLNSDALSSKDIKNFILDEKGINLSTSDLTKKIAYFNNNRVELINFFLGRPDGFEKNNSEFEKISLSKMTFPHSLVRVILCEQIYRCATILSNHPYHRC